MRRTKGEEFDELVRALEPGCRVYHPKCDGLAVVRIRGKAGRRSWVLRYTVAATGVGKGKGKPRELTLARYDIAQATKVVARAQEMRARIREGKDPQAWREETRVTLKDFRVTYQKVVAKKESTVRSDDALFDLHILPRLGKRYVSDITPTDVTVMRASIATPKTVEGTTPTWVVKGKDGKPDRVVKRKKTPDRVVPMATRGNRAVALLSHVLSVAYEHGLRPAGPLPRKSIRRAAEVKRDKFLSPEQMQTLADVLRGMLGTVHNDAATVLLILMQTGCRKSEIKDLKWSEVDLTASRLRLVDSKTGAKTIALSPAVVAILKARETDRRSPFVFPLKNGSGPRADVEACWRKARKAAVVEWCRVHDLRHSYAAAAVAAGISLPVLGRMLGHKAAATTARYAHVADQIAADAAVMVGTRG